MFSPEPTDAEEDAEDVEKKTAKKPSGWRKLRSMVQWTPFIQTYKHRKYQRERGDSEGVHKLHFGVYSYYETVFGAPGPDKV